MTTTSPEIDEGSFSCDITDLQQRLKNWGYYSGNINGIYGEDTAAAVKKYQIDHGLKVSGTADADTMEAMGLTKIVKTGTALAEGNGVGEEQLLARAINGEARGEPYIGQVAVGAVILNRTRDPKFPKTIAGVIYQPGAFTAVDDGQINVPIDPDSTVVKAARDALNGWDPTGGCIYYWNPATATSPWIWSRQIVTKIGKHNFGK
jgi:N-acetylmuramoyl-L-alanine amidase